MGFGFLNLVKGIQNVRDTLDTLGGMSAAVVKSQEVEKKINAFAELVGFALDGIVTHDGAEL